MIPGTGLFFSFSADICNVIRASSRKGLSVRHFDLLKWLPVEADWMPHVPQRGPTQHYHHGAVAEYQSRIRCTKFILACSEAW
jgi:hypothetical protein